MTYQDQLEEQAATVAEQVLAALALYEAGQLTADALTGVVAAYVAAGNSAAAALADLALSAAVTVQSGRPVAPLGITRPADDPDRLARATETILDDLRVKAEADVEAAFTEARMRFERLADAEIKEAATSSYSEAVKRSSRVTGWTRGLKSDACQLCRWWSRDGQVWHADHPMPTHKGCTCSQLIITRKEAAA